MVQDGILELPQGPPLMQAFAEPGRATSAASISVTLGGSAPPRAVRQALHRDEEG